MLERFVAFIEKLGGNAQSDDGSASPQLAAAALMFAVMDADGVRHEREMHALRSLISGRYDLEGEALESLIGRAERAEAEAVDFYQFTSVLVRLPEDERLRFLGLLWDVVYADGELHELEDNLVWRIAELIGVSGRDRVELRQSAQRAAAKTH